MCECANVQMCEWARYEKGFQQFAHLQMCKFAHLLSVFDDD